MKTVLTVIGTRPEAIKLAPVISVLKRHDHFLSKICITRQHTDLLDPFLNQFGIQPDYDFQQRIHGCSLHETAAHLLKQFQPILQEAKPDAVIVQGDTTSAFIGALAAYYSCIPVAHIEAGLRTGNPYSPWPEETHRSLIAKLSAFSFAPTTEAKKALVLEGVAPEKIWVVGNTSIDAVRLSRKTSQKKEEGVRRIVATVHRRENHGTPLKEICGAFFKLVQEYSDLQIDYCLHPNPSVRKVVEEMLMGVSNIKLLQPLDHSAFISLMDRSDFVVTDSGGIQEEAPFMGKPVLIVRNTTERPEGILAGTAKLAGTTSESVVASCKELLDNPKKLASMSRIHYPYGDGYAAERIVKILEEEL